ncbi:MAG: hypothetical protein WA417_01405, partial [Stellaceae bacterium]
MVKYQLRIPFCFEPGERVVVGDNFPRVEQCPQCVMHGFGRDLLASRQKVESGRRIRLESIIKRFQERRARSQCVRVAGREKPPPFDRTGAADRRLVGPLQRHPDKIAPGRRFSPFVAAVSEQASRDVRVFLWPAKVELLVEQGQLVSNSGGFDRRRPRRADRDCDDKTAG